jgi:adenosine deaminase
MFTKSRIGQQRMRELPKILIHEHLDCSLRPLTMLRMWEEIGFDKAKLGFPKSVRRNWAAAQELRNGRRSKKNDTLIAQLETRAARTYQRFLAKFASSSLENYVQAIVDHVLPLMQTMLNLEQITRERIEDAAADGVAAFELRFAPQLHTWAGLGLDQVMDAVIAGIADAPMPVKLIVCSLRHEDNKEIVPVNPIEDLANLAIKYGQYVGVFDLAADEHKYPGVLPWWLPAAMRVREAGIGLTIHLWETDEPTDQDIEMLERHNLQRIGHGIRGDRQGDRVLEVCPTSNVVTGQVASIEAHPIDRLHREGKKVTVNTDGTLFTRVDLTGEYRKLQSTFGWSRSDFFTVNLTALEASSFAADVKADLRKRLDEAYNGR